MQSDKELLYANLQEGMLQERSRLFQRNLRHNRSLIDRYGGLRKVIPLVQGKKAVILGAGSTLPESLEWLRRWQHHRDIVVIATDMAWRPLRLAGIEPAFAITCETTPFPFFTDTSSSDATLLAFSCSSPSNLRQWQGDYSFYNWMLRGEPWDAMWQDTGDLGFLGTGSVVTTQALAFAIGAGATSVLLLGNDLAFQREYHSRGTASRQRLYGKVSRMASMEGLEFSRTRKAKEYMIVHKGREFFTTPQFLAARYWMEDLLKQQDVDIIDGSIPGLGQEVRRIAPGVAPDWFSRQRKRRRR